jgi:alpha-tubulin suppressor-like RCC1 family protein
MRQSRSPLAARVVAAALVAASLISVPATISAVSAGAAVTGQAFSAVQVGTSNTCALSINRTLFCWGSNHYGQLMNGTVVPRLTPTPINLAPYLAGGSVVSFATGNGSTCVLTDHATLYCWGYGGQGQLGNGLYQNGRKPSRVNFPGSQTGTLIELAGNGASSYCALTSTSQIFCWGGNVYGQLGNAATHNSAVPVMVHQSTAMSGHQIADINGSEQTFCAVTTDGLGFCWGFGLADALGNGASKNSSTPVAVVASGALKGHQLHRISAATDHSCGIDTTANVYCWGSNRFGTDGLNLPNGASHTTSWRSTPQLVNALTGLGVKMISSSYTESCALTGAGRVYCWGAEPLGDGQVSGYVLSPKRISLGALATAKIIDVSSGNYATCAIDNIGSLYCWGANTNGVVGDGTTGLVAAPTEIAASPSTIPVTTVPTAPVGIAVNPGNGTITVTWSPPASNGQSPITKYSVTTTPSGAGCVTAALSCTLTHLTPTTGYVVSVVAHNAVGAGQAGNSVPVFPVNPAHLTVYIGAKIQSPRVPFLVIVAGMKKGTAITITIAGVPKLSCVISALRQCVVTVREPNTGVFRIIAKNAGIVATNFFYVPLLSVATKIIHGHSLAVHISSCPPLAQTRLKFSDGRVYTPKASSAGYVSISVPMPRKGTFGLLTQVQSVQLIPDRSIKVL